VLSYGWNVSSSYCVVVWMECLIILLCCRMDGMSHHPVVLSYGWDVSSSCCVVVWMGCLIILLCCRMDGMSHHPVVLSYGWDVSSSCCGDLEEVVICREGLPCLGSLLFLREHLTKGSFRPERRSTCHARWWSKCYESDRSPVAPCTIIGFPSWGTVVSIASIALRTVGSDYRLRLTTKVLSTTGEGA
jgi:hypothetical protein